MSDTWEDLRRRAVFAPRPLVLDFAVRAAHSVEGNIIEFGVASGTSTRVLRASLTRLERGQIIGRRKRIFACDSFQGLSEQFEALPPGALACEPPRIRGVEIVEGYFEDSLTAALARRVGRVSLASLDADLHSSTLCALRWLTPLLHTGSLLLFDEFLGERESEKRAFEEWSHEHGVRTIQIAQFLRDPSGGSSRTPDSRVLVQVVGDEPHRSRRIATLRTIVPKLRNQLVLRTRRARR